MEKTKNYFEILLPQGSTIWIAKWMFLLPSQLIGVQWYQIMLQSINQVYAWQEEMIWSYQH